MAYTFWLRAHLKDVKKELSNYLNDPRIAITEVQGGRDLDISATMLEALFYSGIINTAINLNGFIEIITHSSLMWFGGGLRKEREIVYPTPAYFAQKLYATQPGRWPAKVKISTPMFSVSSAPPEIPDIKNAPYIDAVALLNDNESILSLIITNFHPIKPIKVSVSFKGFTFREDVKLNILSGVTYLSGNSWNYPEAVRIVESIIVAQDQKIEYVLPPCSIVLFTLNQQKY